ncbi:MAG: toxin-antitoxin system, antitoxin component, Xre family protein [Acidobacteriota bacterium]
MSVKARYESGVFKPIEEVRDAAPDKVYQVFSDEELRDLAENVAWLRASEKSFAFWDNPEDAIYDRL